jgi:hypothetical protein
MPGEQFAKLLLLIRIYTVIPQTNASAHPGDERNGV